MFYFVGSVDGSFAPIKRAFIGILEMLAFVDIQTLKLAWSILDRRERHIAKYIIAFIMFSALSAPVMVVSIMPFLSVLSNPALIETNAMLQRAYQWGGFESKRGFILALGLGSICAILVSYLLQVLRIYVLTRYVNMRAHNISVRLLSSYLRQPYEFFLNNNSGEMCTTILWESEHFVTQFLQPAGEACSALLTLTALLGLLLYVDFTITLMTFAVLGGIYAWLLLLTRKKLHRIGDERGKHNARRFQIASEALGAVREIKLLGREWFYLDQFQEPSLQMYRGVTRYNLIGCIPPNAMQSITLCGLILLSLVLLATAPEGTSQQVITDILPTIGLLAFAGQRMLPELSRLFASITQLNYGKAAVHKIYDALEIERSVQALPREPAKVLTFVREITFENVCYLYGKGNKAGLSDVTLRIRAGERVGIVGTTGAGKSTLVNVLLGLLPPSAGRMMVDGAAITPDILCAWQRNIGLVPQEILLIDASIRENIAFGVPFDKIDDAKVRKAATIAQVNDFIVKELANGYDTEVGERGVRLSGGQRQRIGIARALYEDPKVLLLDEATSSLDTPTELDVMRAIDALPGDITIVMIAHRLTTLRNCDRLILMESGCIVSEGSWSTLLASSPEFRRMTEISA